ncbi:hypothetical protein E7Z53_17430 [Kocuria salina]|uniref:hypothetical protein n=1 Tax=Kocuria salina TaxID=1929416 RepID=UPI001594B7F2|nr:hypothetical protein [Kocuria salina]NVC25207.1 hypothetical protein [Kocuria salina]
MVMFEPQRDFPRAYVALPALPEDAVLPALKWAFKHSETGAWESVGLRVAQRSTIRNVPVLQKLEKHGVRISTDRHTNSNQSPRGPLIVYRPDVESLVAAEDFRGASAIVAISANNEWLQPWVDAYHPEHLGGDVVPPANPTVREPVVWEALEAFTGSINSSTGLGHPSDFDFVLDGLQQLRKHGYAFTADELLAGALKLNWRGSSAMELHQLASEILAGKNKRYRNRSTVPNSRLLRLWEEQAAGKR